MSRNQTLHLDQRLELKKITARACCLACEAIGAAPHGLLGCPGCAEARFRDDTAAFEAELVEALNAADEFPLAVWLEWCAANEDPDAPSRKERKQAREDARDHELTMREAKSYERQAWGCLWGDGVEV